MEDKFIPAPFITQETIVFGILMLTLALVFYTSSSENKYFKKFYKIIPALFMCYFLPAILTTTGLIGQEWHIIENGEPVKVKLQLYNMAKNYLLPAALVLMIISIDLKAIFRLGFKSLAMFFTGTVGIILGGPIAILIIGYFTTGVVVGDGANELAAEGFSATWRGLATLAGSWIGGGANQTAMLELYSYKDQFYGAMVFIDIVVANIWMAFLLYGVGKKDKIDKWLKADSSAIEDLKNRVEAFSKSVSKMPTLTDYMKILGLAFFAISISHFLGNYLSDYFKPLGDESILSNKFFWLVVLATAIGIGLSFTKLKNLEGAGAMKVGSVFIYILVATIGMKMDILKIFDNPLLVVLGLIWMAIHVGLLFLVAKIIKAPYFFLAVGSKANVGGAASAPIVAAAFHPSLATVGVLLAVLGYAVGTYGAIACAYLMERATLFVIGG